MRLLVLLCGLCLITAASTANAQQEPSAEQYGQVLNAPADNAGDAPAQPPGTDTTSNDPDLAAYGQVAEVYKSESALEMTQQRVGVFQQKARRVVGAADTYFTDIVASLDQASPTGSASYFLGVVLFTAILLAIGRAAVTLYALYIALPIMRSIQQPNPQGMVEKLPVLAARVGLQLVGIVLALLVAAAVGAGFYQEDEPTLKTVIAVTGGFVMIQIIDVLWRMVVSPYLSDYRIPAFSDKDSRRLYRWLAIGATVGVTTNVLLSWMREMGIREESIALTAIALTTLSLLLIFLMVRSCGQAISNALLGGYSRAEASRIAAVASYLWRPLFLGYMTFAGLEMGYRLIMGLELGVPLLGGAFTVLLAALVVYAATVYVIERAFRRARTMRDANRAMTEADMAEDIDDIDANKLAIRDSLEDVDADDGEEGGSGPAMMRPLAPPPRRRGMHTFEDLARRVASIFALGAAAYALIRIWLGAEAFAEGSNFDIVQDLIDVCFLGYIAFHGARIWMDQKIELEGGADLGAAEPGDEGGAGAAASRLATILPLFRSFVLLVIATTAVFLVLLQLGINVAPLFAGAGVVGLAIGFGAQSLVRDILSGVFFLSDDAFRKGEYIDVGDVKGTVEKISLRSFQLRHHLGALNTIPFGEIKHLTNYSRDWVMMKLPLRLTYDTDVDKVRKLIKKLGQELLDHPTEGHKFVQPLKSQGVYMMEDSAMIIRIKFMTRPGDQWTTRKLIYQEIRSLFEREGIKFAHKEVTVRIPDLDDPVKKGNLNEDERKAVGAAARRAVEEEIPVPAGGDDR
ncbi:MAG: mechanosensitive ion channel domain-containing protein [Pseudomonadota bacterium]